MSTPVLPTIITGPGVISFGGNFFYFKKDVTVEDITESFMIESSAGDLDERFKSRIRKITATPVGELRSDEYILAHYPFGPADIGNTIMNGALVIYSIPEGKTYSYNRAGISDYPEFNASPTKQPYGAMSWSAIGAAATQPTDAAFWKTISTAPLTDSSFDDATIVTDIYTATIGARATPFDAVGSMAGFKIKPVLKTKAIIAEDIGVADIRVENIGLGLEFAPSNLTEAQVDTLLGLQGSDALLVGQSFAKADEDIVIASDYLTITCYKMGAKKWSGTYDSVEHRHKNLEFTNKRSGAIYSNANPLFLFTVN